MPKLNGDLVPLPTVKMRILFGMRKYGRPPRAGIVVLRPLASKLPSNSLRTTSEDECAYSREDRLHERKISRV